MRLEIGISMLTVCSAFSQDVNVRILIPERTFVLSQPDSKVKVREVHATSDALWFLVQDKDARFRLLATDFGGNLKTSASISTDNAVGLTSTSKGIATVIAKGKQRVLTEFDLRGSVVSETALGCYGSESLFSIDGNPTTVCPDGALMQHLPTRQSVRRLSWILLVVSLSSP